MTISADWERLATLIRSFCESYSRYRTDFQSVERDGNGAWIEIDRQCKDLGGAIETFRQQWCDALPPSADSRFRKFEEEYGIAIGRDTSIGKAGRVPELGKLAYGFSAFVAQVAYELSDPQASIRSHTERAFPHLQRSIVADGDARSRWQAAFAKGETECERIGSLHLLAHGIWAFKTSGAGERSDLILADEPFDIDAVQRTSEGLVLTEWKKASNVAEGEGRYLEARKQADRYSCGLLGGVELRKFRYLIVVSEKHLKVREDGVENGVTYRHGNIVVDPDPPSKGR